MTFLSPIPALVAAGFAVPALVVLYLLKLRRRPARVSSVMFWSQSVQDLQANVPLRWIRPSWLLALHGAILGLLLCAMGRPSVAGGEARASRTILVVDHSASMSARDMPGGGTRLDAAKQHAELIARRAVDAGGSVCVVGLAGESQPRSAFSKSLGVLRDTIAGIEATDQPGDLAAAARLATALVGQSQEEERAREPVNVVFVTDGSFAEHGALSIPGARVRVEAIVPPERETGPDNEGIVAISALRDFQDPGVVRVFVRVVNAARQARAVPLTLSLDGRVVERRVIDVPASGEAARAERETGFGATTFEMSAPEGGVVMVTIDRADALESDNAGAVVLAPPKRPGVVVVRATRSKGEGEKSEGAADGTGAGWLLDDILREMSLSSLRVMRPEEAAALWGERGAVDLIVFDGVTPSVLPPIPSLSLGASLPVAGVRARAHDAAGGTDVVLLWDRAHPVLRHVPLDSLVLAKRAWFDLDPGRAPKGVALTELARGRDGAVIIQCHEGDVRRIAVAFAPEDSNWPLQFGFSVFLASAVDYLTLRAEGAVGRSFTTSTAASVGVRAVPGSVTLVGPERITLGGAGTESLTSVSAGRIRRAGVYVVEGSRALDRAVGVNLGDETESRLGTSRSLGISGVLAAAKEATATRELWAWFVLAAGALLVVEWCVYGAKMRA